MKKVKEPIHGVYFLIKNNDIVYIGCSKNIVKRLGHHDDKDYDFVSIFECSINEMHKKEQKLINEHLPKYNDIQDKYIEINERKIEGSENMETDELVKVLFNKYVKQAEEEYPYEYEVCEICGNTDNKKLPAIRRVGIASMPDGKDVCVLCFEEKYESKHPDYVYESPYVKRLKRIIDKYFCNDLLINIEIQSNA